MNRIITRVIRLPKPVRGYTSFDSNGDYNIYINSILSNTMRKKTYNHEVKHIKRDDWNDSKTLFQAESAI